jgi:hypothetical protein
VYGLIAAYWEYHNNIKTLWYSRIRIGRKCAPTEYDFNLANLTDLQKNGSAKFSDISHINKKCNQISKSLRVGCSFNTIELKKTDGLKLKKSKVKKF